MENIDNNLNRNLKEPEKKIVPVVDGTKLKDKKESELHKFGKKFVSEDAKDVGSHIFDSVIVPGIQDLISKALKNAIDFIFLGARGSSNNSGSVVKNIGYSSLYGRQNNQSSTPKPAVYTYREKLFDSRGEAELVLASMKDVLEMYKRVTVADYCDFLGIQHSYTDCDYGWYDLSEASIGRNYEGYYINLPKVVPLK